MRAFVRAWVRAFVRACVLRACGRSSGARLAWHRSLFAAGAVLISMGACLGKTTPVQLLVMAVLELFFFGLNETIVAYVFVRLRGRYTPHSCSAWLAACVSVLSVLSVCASTQHATCLPSSQPSAVTVGKKLSPNWTMARMSGFATGL